jgi:hypothetical protein
MPLCPQITNTPITVVQNSDFVVSNVVPVVPATTTQVNEALDDAAVALAEANDAYAAAIGSLQPSANTIVNASNQMTAINAGGITVYSGALPDSGARVRLNSLGLAGFDSGGNATFSISASTGAAVFSGSVTGATITGGTLNIGGNAIINSSGFLTATGANITGTITATSGSFTGTITSSTITGGTVQTSTGSNAIILNSASNALQFKVAGAISGNIVPLGTAGVLMHYGTTPDPTGSTFPKVQMSFSTALLQASSSYYIQSTNAGNNALGDFRMFNNLQVDGNTVLKQQTFIEDSSISAATPNARIDSDGRLRRTTGSSQRFKEDIVDLSTVAELAPNKLLQLPVRAFKFKADYLDVFDNRVGILVPGFIAEEVGEFYSAAADFDAQGNAENWSERFIIPGMLALIQDLYKEIATLKGE